MTVIRSLQLQNAFASICLFSMILIVSIAGFLNRKIFVLLFFHPYSVVNDRQYFRLFTSDLVHVNLPHLALNILMLYAGCVGLENYLSGHFLHGHFLFLGIYLISHFTGITLVTFKHYKDFNFSSAGASGSIMGCLFCYMILQPSVVAFYLLQLP